jgi:hypothetical protein
MTGYGFTYDQTTLSMLVFSIGILKLMLVIFFSYSCSYFNSNTDNYNGIELNYVGQLVYHSELFSVVLGRLLYS